MAARPRLCRSAQGPGTWVVREGEQRQWAAVWERVLKCGLQAHWYRIFSILAIYGRKRGRGKERLEEITWCHLPVRLRMRLSMHYSRPVSVGNPTPSHP